ncbi:hypothetical protein EDC01DRAFT_666027 [Geopyxis carbonaria]|nr:hypothetical protein EDC01DRAFT_666027 [Geopyxis carbonaria]
MSPPRPTFATLPYDIHRLLGALLPLSALAALARASRAVSSVYNPLLATTVLAHGAQSPRDPAFNRALRHWVRGGHTALARRALQHGGDETLFREAADAATLALLVAELPPSEVRGALHTVADRDVRTPLLPSFWRFEAVVEAVRRKCGDAELCDMMVKQRYWLGTDWQVGTVGAPAVVALARRTPGGVAPTAGAGPRVRLAMVRRMWELVAELGSAYVTRPPPPDHAVTNAASSTARSMPPGCSRCSRRRWASST